MTNEELEKLIAETHPFGSSISEFEARTLLIAILERLITLQIDVDSLRERPVCGE